MRRRFTVRSGLETFGPLYESAPPAGGAPAGDPAPAGAGGGAPAGGAGGAPATPPAADDKDQMIPKARFDQILKERNDLAAAEQKRKDDELKAKGEHEKRADNEKARADSAEQKATTAFRRLAFVAAATGKVADVTAAYKLAAADGALDKIEIDDDGNAKDPKAVGTTIDELVKTYEFLKPGKPGTGRGFGGNHGGTDAGPGIDPDKMTAREKMEAGIAASTRS